MITAEHKTKKNLNGNIHFYTYYHCTKRKDPDCPERKTVEEKILEEQIREKLLKINIPASFKDWAVRYFRSTESKDIEADEKLQESQERAFAAIDKKLGNLLDLRINGEISEQEFLIKKEELAAQKERLKQELGKPKQDHWIKRLEQSMNIATDIYKRFEDATEEEKKQILANLGSNLYLKSKLFDIEASNPILLMDKFSSPVKEISGRFEPPKTRLDKEKLELAYSSSPLLLWR